MRMIKGDTRAFEVPVTRYNPLTGEDEPLSLTGAKAWFTAKETTRDLDIDAIISKNSVDDPTKVVVEPSVAFTGTTVNGSPTISNVSSFTGLKEGVTIEGTGIPANSVVIALNVGAATITIDKNATVSGGGVALTATDKGTIRIILDPVDTETYTGHWLEYDVQIKESDNSVSTVIRGRLELDKHVTISRA